MIVRAFIMRRQRLMRDKEFAGLRVLAHQGSREGQQLDDFLDKTRKQLILRALGKASGNQSQAATLLGISKQAISKFLKQNSDNQH